MRYAVYGLLLLLYALHTDVWYWDDPDMAFLFGFLFGIVMGILGIVFAEVFRHMLDYLRPEFE